MLGEIKSSAGGCVKNRGAANVPLQQCVVVGCVDHTGQARLMQCACVNASRARYRQRKRVSRRNVNW